MDVMLYVWLGVICASAIIEFTTCEIAGIWFVAGGIFALLLASVGVPLGWQILSFVVVSLVLLLSLRKICIKFLLKKDERTNVDALINQVEKLTESITPDKPGALKINDVVWTAVAKDKNLTINKDTKVLIVKISGNKLVVEPTQND